jgi:nucleotide sugar dehydrogenase
MKIIIAGYGFVGKAVANALKKTHEIVIVDPQYTTNEIHHHHDADGIIVCVSTPNTDGGFCDPSNIINVLDQVPVFMPSVVKSTVSPGAVDAIEEMYPDHSIVYSPEFLRAKTSDQDFLNQKYIILGGEDPECFWQELFQTTLPQCRMIFNCTAKEACLVKYSTNSFLALKTSFFNQIYDICLNTGMDFDIVRHIIANDTRIGSGHTLVPGPDGERGWGGACFPKDTAAFVQWSTTIGSPASLVEESVNYNRRIRKNT